jgi:hypothetical protein
MPRKQRFKPSRKPKPQDAPQEPQQKETGDIEPGTPPGPDEDRGMSEPGGEIS